jgi:uncharacterized membrane protein
MMKNDKNKNWHETHTEKLSIGDRLADAVANGMGSWKFIIIQTIIVAIWMLINSIAYIYHWDTYPFILLNLLFSTQAAYAAPIIMMAQNRQSTRDREHAEADYKTNIDAKLEIEELQKTLSKLETEKLNKIIEMLSRIKTVEQAPVDEHEMTKRMLEKLRTDENNKAINS